MPTNKNKIKGDLGEYTPPHKSVKGNTEPDEMLYSSEVQKGQRIRKKHRDAIVERIIEKKR